jgi:predicted transcriptional regulator
MDPLLAQPTRRKIFDVVSARPGASARDIQRAAGLGWGETAYHLEQLSRAGVLRRERGRGRDFYFPASMNWEDRRLLRALRSPAQRRLLLVLSRTPGLTLQELHDRLGLSVSTASFHLRQLLEAALVEAVRDGNVRRYRPVHPHRVAELVRGYQASFEDSLVDRFLDAWSGMFGR